MNHMQDEHTNAFIDECRNRFGAMNKNDYEVAFFHLLLQSPEFKDKSDFNISLTLRMPETKVKRLRYEVELKYPKSNEELKLEFFEVIRSAKYREASGCLKFSITDKMLRLYLNNLLHADGRFADSSFASDIVTIHVADFVYLVSQLNNQQQIFEQVKQSLASADKAKLPESVTEKITGSIEKIFTNIVSNKPLMIFLTQELLKLV